ncbi:hypothetical protein SAMN02745146_2181 [Hymenobacter daecheongensis DSM 21074]|uniref:Nucleotide-diphospho-sugar transferase domain-containing protein n=1 Tax=Hymenobacter daecheongensis DSM 21074 TaxID=1121955 RepID=A0A1M6GAM1_9BACT|nr:hypothetical protein [Hymenobacter daecheongensis]SHJ06964.1 hypothetical protein SAMN02745146_2181 [Hymenobacter daecheongensis DSM 21074]
MNLLYLVFGSNIKNHFQANFSILTFLEHRAGLTSITVVTDAPAFYRHLADSVTVLPVDEKTLQEWKGEYNFFWRIKLKALEYVARQFPATPILYLDSDTFLHGSFSALHDTLRQGTALMHEPEGALSALGSKTEKLMWAQTQGKTYGGVALTAQHLMWNAGVVGIPAQRGPEAIALALRICDELSRQQVTPRLIEQFALSVALAETFGLQAARPYIGHYWSNKDEWNEHIGAFLLESHLTRRTVAQDVAALAQFDFRAVPVKKRLKNTRHRLEKLVRNLFPPKEELYIGEDDQPTTAH